MPADVVGDARVLQLLADPQRWRVLTELADSDRRVGELTERLGKPQNLVSYHLRELRSAGLVSARRSAADGRDTYYRVDLDRCADLLIDAAAALHPAVRLELVPPSPDATLRPRRRTPKVLFLCTGNSARSQIAEALLEHRSGHAIQARSAGSHPKPLHPNAVRVMAERGLDIAEHTTKHFGRFARHRFDCVITLCDKVKEVCPESPGTPQAIHWSVRDPAREPGTDDESLSAFRRTAAELETRIGFLLDAIEHTTGTQEVSEHA